VCGIVFCSEPGAEVCLECAAGYFTNESGATLCLPCPLGNLLTVITICFEVICVHYSGYVMMSVLYDSSAEYSVLQVTFLTIHMHATNQKMFSISDPATMLVLLLLFLFYIF